MNINSGIKTASTVLIVFFSCTLLFNDSSHTWEWEANIQDTFLSYKTIIGITLATIYGLYKAKKDAKSTKIP